GVVRGETLADALGVAEHAGGVGRLVAGDVDEALDAGGGGRLEKGEGAPHIGLDRLARVALEQGKVFEGGGVEHDVGPALPQQVDHADTVTDVEQDEVRRVEQGSALDRQLHAVQGRLVTV